MQNKKNFTALFQLGEGGNGTNYRLVFGRPTKISSLAKEFSFMKQQLLYIASDVVYAGINRANGVIYILKHILME